MAKVAKRKQTSKGLRLEVVNPNAAGIDISPKEMQVCVPSDRDGECNRTFGVYTEDLHYIAEWLMMLHSYGLLKPCFQPERT